MGTNYYLAPPDRALDCDGDDVLHVARRSGRAFTFQGYRTSLLGEICTWARWREVLVEAVDWVLFDEYRTPADPADLIAQVESAPKAERRCRVATSARAAGLPVPLDRDNRYPWGRPGEAEEQWLDADGFLFRSVPFL